MTKSQEKNTPIEGQSRRIWAPDPTNPSREIHLHDECFKDGFWHKTPPRKPGDPVVYSMTAGSLCGEGGIQCTA